MQSAHSPSTLLINMRSILSDASVPIYTSLWSAIVVHTVENKAPFRKRRGCKLPRENVNLERTYGLGIRTTVTVFLLVYNHSTRKLSRPVHTYTYTDHNNSPYLEYARAGPPLESGRTARLGQ